jgi:hypothetical protein
VPPFQLLFCNFELLTQHSCLGLKPFHSLPSVTAGQNYTTSVVARGLIEESLVRDGLLFAVSPWPAVTDGSE